MYQRGDKVFHQHQEAVLMNVCITSILLCSNAIQIQSKEYIQSKVIQCKPNAQPLKANKSYEKKCRNEMKESDQSEFTMRKK